jgi:hypothetical protein
MNANAAAEPAGSLPGPGRRLVFLFLAACFLGVYLLAAWRAPVVEWVDSRLDFDLASRPLGFLLGTPDTGGPMHPLKPLYILFLRAAVLAAAHPGRAVVVAQSILVWISFAGTAMLLGRTRGFAFGTASLAAFFFLLSARDAASAVMPDALATAGLLPLAAVAVFRPPQSPGSTYRAGLAAAGLFFIRQNAGVAIVVLLLAGLLGKTRYPRRVLVFAAGFLSLLLPYLAAQRLIHRPEARSGISTGLVTGSLDYEWAPLSQPWPSAPSPAALARTELRFAASGWRPLLRWRDPDVRRQWAWRLFHGTMGGDYYDARWSRAYRRMDEISRIGRPIATLAAISFIVAGLFFRWSRRAAGAGVLLIALLTAQNLVTGSLPRFGLPYLAALWMLGLACAGRRSVGPAALVFVLLGFFVVHSPQILDREWGLIEKSGAVVRQTIPRGALARGRDRIRVRIGSLIARTSAELSVLDDRGRVLFRSRENPHPERPEIVVPIPEDLRVRNLQAPIELAFVGGSGFTPVDFYVFPVIPPPWSAPARREGSRELSPGTGIESGSLDWW